MKSNSDWEYFGVSSIVLYPSLASLLPTTGTNSSALDYIVQFTKDVIRFRSQTETSMVNNTLFF
jgi:hypothetical protein